MDAGYLDRPRLTLGPGPWILRLNCLEMTTRLLFGVVGALGPVWLARNPRSKLRPSGLITILTMLIYTSLIGLFHDFLWWNRRSLERHSPVPRSFLMRGSDMEPSLNYCDDYLVNVWSRQPVHSEIVAFQPAPNYRGEQEQKVSRVAGLPGDTLQIQDGKMTRNGLKVDEPWRLKVRYPDNGPDLPPITIPAGHYLCVSDMRFPMYATPYWELVPSERLLGKVVLISNSVDYERVGLNPAKPEPVR